MELQPGIWRTKRKWLISRNSHGFLETPGRAGQARAFGYVVVCHSSGHLSYQSLAGAKLQSTSIPKEIAPSMVKEVQQEGKAEKDGKAKEEWKAKQDRKEKGKQGKNDKGKERA